MHRVNVSGWQKIRSKIKANIKKRNELNFDPFIRFCFSFGEKLITFPPCSHLISTHKKIEISVELRRGKPEIPVLVLLFRFIHFFAEQIKRIEFEINWMLLIVFLVSINVCHSFNLYLCFSNIFRSRKRD